MKRIRIVKAATEIEPEYMTIKNLSLYSGQGQTKLRERINSGDLSAYKVGGVYYVKLSEFHEWMEKHRYKPDLDRIVDEVVSEFK